MLKSLTLRSSRILAVTGLLAFAGAVSPSTAHAACLQVDGAAWLNTCGQRVWVNWNDNAWCQNWSCSDYVGPYRRSSASIGSQVAWCEFYNGRTGRGPC